MKAEPGLMQFVKELPREQPKRTFLLRKIHCKRSTLGWKSPSRPSWFQSSPSSPETKSKTKAQALVNQAKNYVGNTGIKIS